MRGTLATMTESGEIAHARTHTDLIIAIESILRDGETAEDLRDDVAAEDITASLIGISTVAPLPERGPWPSDCSISRWSVSDQGREPILVAPAARAALAPTRVVARHDLSRVRDPTTPGW
jgi:hypothetical protein